MSTWCDGDDSKPKCGECAGCLREKLTTANRLNGEYRKALEYIASCDECAVCECADHAKVTLGGKPVEGGHWCVRSHDSPCPTCGVTGDPPTTERPKEETVCGKGDGKGLTPCDNFCPIHGVCPLCYHQYDDEAHKRCAEKRKCEGCGGDLHPGIKCSHFVGGAVGAVECNHVPDHNPETGRTYCERCGITL